MAMTSVPRPEDSRRVAPHEETIVGSHNGMGSGSNIGSKPSHSGGGLGSAIGLHETPATPPVSVEEFSASLTASGLMTREELDSFCETHSGRDALTDANALADLLVQANKLTPYQVETLRQGHTRGLVLGNYVILEKLGEGGMGMVFLARHRLMKRSVALKVLPPSMTQSADAVARFHREVEAAAKLQYANIAGAFDADQADGIHFLVMEYVEGPNLAALVREAGPLSPAVTMNIIAQAARGLLHAHENGVVHRDIKPGNLLVSKEGVVKILDMGLAQLQSSEENDGAKAELTQSGRIMGTVDYMAPEQALDAKTVDQRADIYSLGCTLFFLLAGHPMSPEGTLTQKLLWHQTEPVPSLKSVSPTIPDELDAIYHKMVAKRADDRFHTMGELLQRLEPLLASVPPEELKLPTSGVGLSKDTGSVTNYSGRGKLTMVDRATRTDAGGTIGWQDSHRPISSPLSVQPKAGVGKLLAAAAGLGLIGIAVGVGMFVLMAPPKQPGNQSPITTAGEASIIIVSDQPNAVVIVDNKEVGQTNGAKPYDFKLTLPPGKHALRVERKGFASYSQNLVVKAGQPELTLQASFASQPVTLVVTSDIPGVQVSIDDRHRGTVSQEKPYQLTINDVMPGKRVIRLEAEGYAARDITRDFQPGDNLSLPAKLSERPYRSLLNLVFSKANPNADEPVIVFSDEKGQRHDAKSWSDMPESYGSIQDIYLKNTSLSEADIKELAKAVSLEKLSLSGAKISEAGIQSLQLLTGLKKLDLSMTGIGSPALTPLQKLKQLTELDLRGTKITDMGLLSLAHLEKLETLRLTDTTIGDEGLKHLLGLKNLQTLSLDGTRATLESYELFAAAFKERNPINKDELDPELGLARKLLRNGAQLMVQKVVGPNNQPQSATVLSDLPSEKFHIVGIASQRNPKFTDELMPQLVDLKHLTEIDLDGSQVTDNGLARLREIPSLRKVNLGFLGVAKSTVDSLKQNLGDAKDNITWEGPRDRIAAQWVLRHGGKVVVASANESKLVRDIAALPENSVFQLQEIHLPNKPEVVDADLTIFMDLGHLTTLNLVGTSITEEGIKKLTGLGKLQTLCLSGKNINNKVLAIAVSHFSNLERLYVSDTAIGKLGMDQIGKLKGLTQLSLAGTTVGDNDLAPLSALPNLVWLSLDGTALTDDALRFLKPLESLKVLSLDDRRLDDMQRMMDEEMLPEAAARTSMRITDAGIEELEKALPGCKILHRPLDPERQAAKWVLEHSGSVVVKLADAQPDKLTNLDKLPRSACQVQQVSLKSNRSLPENFLDGVLKSCPNLTVLDLSDTNITSDQLSTLASFPRLTALNLEKTGVDDKVFQKLTQLPALRALNLSTTDVTGRTLETHPLPASLTHLYLGTSGFRGDYLKHLVKSPDLIELDLTACKGLNDNNFAELAGLSKLQRLDLKLTRLTDASAPTLAKFKDLIWLNLQNVPITDAMVGAWKEMPNLEMVNLSQTKVTDASMAHLDGFKKLKSVAVRETAVTAAGTQALRARDVTVSQSQDPAPRDENTGGTTGRFGAF